MSSNPLQVLMASWTQFTSRAPAFDEEASRVRWVEAFSRRHAGAVPARAASRQYLSLAAAAVLLVAVGLGGWWWGFAESRPSSELAPGAWLETRAKEQLPMHFGEGSEVVVQERSRVHVASVDPRGARMVLERGTVSANIVHRADTRWAFVAGPFQVKVTGTELAVRWDPGTQEFDVSVSSGSVYVTGPLLETGRSVLAGQQCRVVIGEQRLEVTRVDAGSDTRHDPDAQEDEAEAVDVEALPLADEGQGGEPHATQQAQRAVVPEPDLPTWRRLEREGRYREALHAAEEFGVEMLLGQGSVMDLMSLARASRLAGRAGLAKRALLQVRAKAPASHQAATAAFLLGRAAAPGEAAKWFSSYLREQPTGLLAREASGRLIESLHRAGQFTAAQDAARRYLARYPAGPHAAFARSVLGKQ